MVRITAHDRFDELSPWRSRWNELARGLPFRRWEWLETWWRHYGADAVTAAAGRLLLLAAWEGEELIGVAPWYTSRLWSEGRSLRTLGAGEVCSEYVTILSAGGCEDRVAAAFADWLSDGALHADANHADWDFLELTGVVDGDEAASRLLSHLTDRGNSVYRRPGLSCWRIDLPSCWGDFVARLSKSHRKQVRRAARKLTSKTTDVRRATSMSELHAGFDVLVELHQRRWQSMGERGCFARPRFLLFHREVSARLFEEGCVELTWIEHGGRPLAAEYHLTGDGVIYAYQSGIDPNRLDQDPGRMAVAATIQRSIEQGFRGYDFLRGDEPYKAHWRAQPQPTWEIRIVPRRATARFRQGIWTATDRVKGWIRSGLELTGLR